MLNTNFCWNKSLLDTNTRFKQPNIFHQSVRNNSSISVPIDCNMESIVTESVGNSALEEPPAKTFKQMTAKERVCYIKESITVEPLIATYLISATLTKPAMLVLEYEKACKANLALNDTVCDTTLNSEELNYSNEIIQIQSLISYMYSWQAPTQSIMPLILVLFLGSYSDRRQWRKPFLLLPLIGELIAVAGCIISVFFMRSWSLELHGVVQAIIPSFFGGQAMLVMAAFAYIADVSTLKMRTLRVGIVQIVIKVCVPAVQTFSDVLFKATNYTVVLLIAAAFYLFGIVYGVFWIEEPRRPDKTIKKNFLVDIFDIKHVIDTFKLGFKKNPDNDRVFILTVLVGMFVYTMVTVGETFVFSIYVMTSLHWGVFDFMTFENANTLIHLVGTIIAVLLFVAIFKLQDLTILLLCFLSKIVCNIIFGHAKDSVLMYVGSVLSSIIGLTFICLRSLATKVVSSDDVGKTQSLFGIVEAIFVDVVGPAVGAHVYQERIYIPTFERFPWAFLYFSALVYAAYSVVIILMYLRERRKLKEAAAEDCVKNNDEIEETPIQIDIPVGEVTHM